MVKNHVSIYKTVDFLNKLLVVDSDTISALFSMRITCNEALANHETVQVRQLGPGVFQVGMIGILNGLFGIDEHGWGHVVADYKNGKIIGFRVLTTDDVKKYVEPEDYAGDQGC